jgi:hypothetical protein
MPHPRRNSFLLSFLVVMATMAATMTVSYRWPQYVRPYLVVMFAIGIAWGIVEYRRRRRRPDG